MVTVPDYPGNRRFNTLGNLLLEPRNAVVILDFDSGDILQLQGLADVAWQAADLPDTRAERAWTFSITRGWLRRAAFPMRQVNQAL